MSSLQSRQEEIAAKKAKLAELKRQRERRQKDFASSRQSVGVGDSATELAQPSPIRQRATHNEDELNSLISSLVDRPSSAARVPGTPGARVSDIDQAATSTSAPGTPTAAKSYKNATTDTQLLAFTDLTTLYEIHAESKPEIITYSKGVQTGGLWQSPQEGDNEDGPDADGRVAGVRTHRRSLSPREKEREQEELRQRLRREIQEELHALKLDGKVSTDAERFPGRTLAPDELHAVTGSADFVDFVDRSSKVVERALDEEYDVLADYALQSRDAEAADDEAEGRLGRRGYRIKEYAAFDLDDSMGSGRLVSSIDFSPKFSELFCTSYTKSQNASHTPPGLLNVWNLHLKGRPEYSLHATSDLLSVLFHPHHPSLILGGTYAGQLCLWDTRARHQRTGEPVQKTPLAGGRTGHAHPIYSLAVVGTTHASSIVSVSTDGVACAWSADILSLPQEYLELRAPHPGAAKTDDVAPTCIAFPSADPTYFLAGTEQGSILPVHRYDRAGARAGIDARTFYPGHAAPVTALDFHPSRGPADLGDLFVSAGLDWSVKIWRARAPAAAGSQTTIAGVREAVAPLLDLSRDEPVYAIRWHPLRPGVFACVDAAGRVDVHDLLHHPDTPVARAEPARFAQDAFARRSQSCLGWEKHQGRFVGVGGLDGIVSVFEVGAELTGVDTRAEKWVNARKWVAKQEGRVKGGLVRAL